MTQAIEAFAGPSLDFHIAVMAYPSYWQKFPGAVEREVFQSSILRASDGYPLNVYAAGDAKNETVVIASPPTIPFLLMSKLAASLSRYFHVISWETRGGPYLDEKSDSFPLFLDRHARDLAEILSSGETGPLHYIGWCGGAWIICWAVLNLKLPVRSISLIAPNKVDGGKEQTAFQKLFTPIVKRVGDASPDEMESLFKVIRATSDHPHRTPAEQVASRVAGLNIETLESTRKWARVIRDFDMVSESIDEPIGGERAIKLFDELCGRAPLLMLHCRDDDIVSYKCSLMASERNPGSKLVLYPVGGHAVAYLNEPTVSEDIGSFIRLGHSFFTK
jgi:pimeloyl-ACP methyl ester carboxylesterase